jgi:hypothetical protein
MVKRIIINVGWCAVCQYDTKVGTTYNPEKRHNCLNCGYMNRYNEELIKYDSKTNVVLFSSVR